MLPLLPDFALDTLIAFGRQESITAAQFLADVEHLAARLPSRRYVLNDCFDRYRFLVGFVAALKRGQVSLFPSNRVAYVWQQLQEDYPDVYCLTDQGDVPAVMPVVTDISEGMERSAGDAAIPAFPSSQLAAIAFTSGSTGRPKAFPKHWGAVVREAQAGGRRLGLVPRGGAIVATVPPQHMYGFVTSIMLPLQFGYATCRERPFYPEDIRLALESSPTPAPVLVITPTQLRACVLEKTRLPALAFILSSAAPLPRATAQEAEASFGARALEYYGSTETGAIASRRQLDSDIWRTFDGVRVRPHEEGYWVDADYFPEPVLLNDSVEILNQSEFRLLGRNTDLVKIGGKRASLLHLNQQLQEIPGVQDGAFVLEEVAGGREARLAALVVAPTLDRQDILAALRTRMDDVFLPRKLYRVPALPRNAAGKLPREQLMQLFREQSEDEAIVPERD